MLPELSPSTFVVLPGTWCFLLCSGKCFGGEFSVCSLSVSFLFSISKLFLLCVLHACLSLCSLVCSIILHDNMARLDQFDMKRIKNGRRVFFLSMLWLAIKSLLSQVFGARPSQASLLFEQLSSFRSLGDCPKSTTLGLFSISLFLLPTSNILAHASVNHDVSAT